MKTKQVILITGASSGIGFESAKNLAEQGNIVYAAARRTDKMEPLRSKGVHILAMDVTSEASMQQGVDSIMKEQGRIDVLVNNAGYGYFGAIETVSLAEARRQIEVNLFGLARLCQMVMPSMRDHHYGKIINVSSVAGRAVIAFGGWYNVSKYAVEALSDALRIEAKQFGIDVVLIEPSGIKTEWGVIAADNLEASSQGTVYEKNATAMASIFRKAYLSDALSSPDTVRRCICKAVNSRRPRLRYHPGMGARTMIALHTLMPARWWDALMRMAILR